VIIVLMMAMKTHQYEYERGKTMLKCDTYFSPNQ
jgi:hypothetical protein